MTGIFAVIFQVLLGGFSGHEAAIFEGVTMLIAAVLLSTMIVWMARNKNVAESLEKEASSIIERDKPDTSQMEPKIYLQLFDLKARIYNDQSVYEFKTVRNTSSQDTK